MHIYEIETETVYCASSSPMIARFFSSLRSTLRSRAALFFARLASNSALMRSSRAFSALAVWIC